jgi:HEPN domain-containing protein
VLDLKESENVNRASDWLRQAERDLGFAETGAGAGYHEGAAFYAQQSGEKAVKALIQFLHGGSGDTPSPTCYAKCPSPSRLPRAC